MFTKTKQAEGTMTELRDEAVEAEAEFPRKGSSGSGGERSYTVEARYMFNGLSEIVNGMALGPTWARVHFPQSPIGVPKGRSLSILRPEMSEGMAYASAQALRWWFIANAAMEHHDICLETRLIRHDMAYTHADTLVSAVGVVDGSYERDLR